MRVSRTLVGLACSAAVACAASAEASASTLSLRASAPRLAGYRAIDYTRSFSLSGRLSTHKAGVKVALQADAFPFTTGFQTVRQARTRKHGTFHFKTKLGAATRYRAVLVASPATVSRVVTVYAMEHSVFFSCNICGSRAGGTTVRVKATYQVPVGLVAEHAARKIYVYFAVISGSAAPTRLQLRKTVHQHVSSGQVSYSYVLRFHPPPGVWTWQVEACFRDREASDGFGLPGRHQCGNGTITIGSHTYLG